MNPVDLKWAIGVGAAVGITISALCIWIAILRHQVREYKEYAQHLGNENLELQKILQRHNQQGKKP